VRDIRFAGLTVALALALAGRAVLTGRVVLTRLALLARLIGLALLTVLALLAGLATVAGGSTAIAAVEPATIGVTPSTAAPGSAVTFSIFCGEPSGSATLAGTVLVLQG
jgi:hypothetical protein